MSKGFTLLEIIIVGGIMITLITITSMGLGSLQNKTNLSTTVNLLLSDIKQQQLKAMVGDTETRSAASAYGVYFDSASNPQRYILFNGASYVPNDPGNFAVDVESNISFSSTLPGNSLIFSQINGELNGYVSNQNTVTVSNSTSNSQKVIRFNRYGAVTQVN